MKGKPVIGLLSVLLVCLVLLVPFVGCNEQSDMSEAPTSSVLPSLPASEAATNPSESVPTEPSTQPAATQPSTRPAPVPTTPSADSYSENPKVISFIELRMKSWTCPVKDPFGEVTGSRRFATSRGGGKRAHAGLDFVAPHGTKVYAITSGLVQRVAVFYQNTWAVEVLNDDGSILRYCEIATNLKQGDYVRQGDVIGTILRADGGTEMLHMEVYMGDGEGMLTQTWNESYLYVDNTKKFLRRSDLLDPTFLKNLPCS